MGLAFAHHFLRPMTHESENQLQRASSVGLARDAARHLAVRRVAAETDAEGASRIVEDLNRLRTAGPRPEPAADERRGSAGYPLPPTARAPRCAQTRSRLRRQSGDRAAKGEEMITESQADEMMIKSPRLRQDAARSTTSLTAEAAGGTRGGGVCVVSPASFGAC